jgi:hypothetical protein
MEKREARQLDTTPFLALALAGSLKARAEIDKIYKKAPADLYKRAKKPKYEIFYKDRDVLTLWYCRRAEALIEAYDTGESGASLENIVEKCWGNIYHYVQNAPEPASFDSFQIDKARTGQKIGGRGIEISPHAGSVALRKPQAPKEAGRGARPSADGEAGEDFLIFGQAAVMLHKTINWQEPFLISIFSAYERAYEERNRPDAEPADFLSAKQKETAEELLKSVELRLGGLPASLDEYFQTEEYQSNKTGKYFFFHELLRDLPIAALRETPVGKKHLRRAVESLIARLPEDAEITDDLRRTALDAVLYALLMRAIAKQYAAAVQYALRGLEQKAPRREEE